MMEQAHAGERHRHVVPVARFDHIVVAHGAARLSHIRHTRRRGALDIVAEREERVRAEGHTRY